MLFEGSVRARVLVALWAAALLCAPVVARERELKMLPELILANLSPAQIVRGKWLATLGFAAILLVIPLPLQALAFMMGGVSPGEWIGAVVLQLGAMILGSALGLWCSALSERVARAMSLACLCAAVVSVPVGIGLANLSLGMWFTTALGVACAALALPLLAGAQNSVEYLPLDAVRPTAVDSSQSSAYAEGQTLLGGEKPSAPLSATDQARLEVLRESEHPASRAARLREGDAEIPRRESWVFGLLRAANWHNPLVWRELRVSARQPFYDVSMLLSVALCLLALPALGATLAESGANLAPYVGLSWIVCGVVCALGAAQGFTREREQRMLEGLLLSTMSPLSIVVGKVAAPILLALHMGALPLALFVAWSLAWSLAHGILMAGIALLGVACFALLGAACGTWLSFWCRTSSVSAMGSLALFMGLLATPVTLSNIGPRAFQDASTAFWNTWLWNPLGQFDGSLAFCAAGLFMCAMMLAASVAMLAHITITLRPKALEREGRSLLHADLTRNLH